MSEELLVGLMSGTSMDAIDTVLVRSDQGQFSVHSSHEHAMPAAIRQQIVELSHSGDNEVERLGILDRELGALFAEATNTLLQKAGVTSAQVTAIGSHGQTIRHRPPSGGHSPEQAFTLQIGDPNTIAQNTGITTVADFRRRDMAAGGEGAPLAPGFHAAAFAHPTIRRAIVNIGGIANITLLIPGTEPLGFDTGPGNTLLDQWVYRHKGELYDRAGRWSAEKAFDGPLLQRLLQHPFLSQSAPKSTGKETFNPTWLEQILREADKVDPQVVQSTLAQFTATTIASGLASVNEGIEEVYVCGGGAHNDDLMRRLLQELNGASLHHTLELGIDGDWVEAVAFAWLAQQTLHGLPGNIPGVTGAEMPCVLGAIYPAP